MTIDRRLKQTILRSPRLWPRVVKYRLAQLLHRPSVTIRSDGVLMNAGTSRGEGGWCAISGLQYEPELGAFLNLLKPGNVVLDVGGNVGTYTLRAAKRVGPSGKVYSFEPMPKTFKRLQKNIQLNRFANVTAHQKAVGAESGTITLSWSGHEGAASTTQGANEHSVEVPLVALDEIIKEAELARVDFVKLDIEGGEPAALRGMIETLRRDKPTILFENGPAADEAINLLTGLGYEIGMFDSNGSWSATHEGINLFARPAR